MFNKTNFGIRMLFLKIVHTLCVKENKNIRKWQIKLNICNIYEITKNFTFSNHECCVILRLYKSLYSNPQKYSMLRMKI